MYALRPASLGLITAAAYAVLRVSVITLETFVETRKLIDIIDIKALILFIFLLVVRIFYKRIHPVIFIVFAGIVGIIFKF